MALVPYHPFDELEKIFDSWMAKFQEDSFPEAFSIEEPKMDIFEQGGQLVVKTEMPGIDPKTINVSIENNMLKLEARKEEKSEEKKKGYYRKEIKSGYLKRVVALPVEVVSDKAEASYKDGVLTIEMPKIAKLPKKEKNIKVKVKK